MKSEWKKSSLENLTVFVLFCFDGKLILSYLSLITGRCQVVDRRAACQPRDHISAGSSSHRSSAGSLENVSPCQATVLCSEREGSVSVKPIAIRMWNVSTKSLTKIFQFIERMYCVNSIFSSTFILTTLRISLIGKWCVSGSLLLLAGTSSLHNSSHQNQECLSVLFLPNYKTETDF